MRISFSPQRSDAELVLVKLGAALLTINGDVLDLSAVPAGATVTDAATLHPMLAGSIEMTEDGPHVTVVLPHGPSPAAAVAYPEDVVDPPNGPVAIPQDEEA